MSKEPDPELIERLAEMTSAGIPLHVGLRAAALDAGPCRIARELDRLASSLSRAESLEAAFAQLKPGVGTPIGELIRAALEAGQLDQVLVELVTQQRARRELRRELYNSLAYPLAVLILFLAITIAFFLTIAPGMAELYVDFDTELPVPTQVVLWLANPGLVLLGRSLGGLALLAIAVRFLFGPAVWRRLLISIPLFGPILQWGGICEWAAFMRILVNARLPLSESLELASRAVSDPSMAATSDRLSQAILDGHSLSGSLMRATDVPLTLGPLIAWGEQHNQLAESLAMAVEIFQGRIHLRSGLLQSILPSLTFILIAAFAVGLVISILLPLIQILSYLT